MLVAKKLLFAIPFLICFYLVFYLSLPFFKSTDYLFSLDFSSLWSLVFLSIAIFLASFFFCVFATLADDWAFVAPVALLAGLSLLALSLLDVLIYIVLSFGVLSLVFWFLDSKLKSYLTFQPGLILGHTISTLAKYLVLLISVVYFLVISPQIKQNGFKLPSSLLNFADGLAPEVSNQTQPTAPALPNISQSQINLLKQHPEVLQQYGVDPSLLDQVQSELQNSSTPSPSSSVASDIVQAQFQNLIKPYINYLPIFLAALFFTTLYSITGIVLIFSGVLLSFTFWVLEKTGFVHFQTEQREVKKLVV